jgi:hypothetical protein
MTFRYHAQRHKQLPADAAVVIRSDVRSIPLVLRTDGSIRTLSMAFLADLENDWREHGPAAIAEMREKNPAQYVMCVAPLARVMRVEIGPAGGSDRPRDPREVMDRLEGRFGPESRKLFEKFLVEVNQLQAEQQQCQLEQRRVPRYSLVQPLKEANKSNDPRRLATPILPRTR